MEALTTFRSGFQLLAWAIHKLARPDILTTAPSSQRVRKRFLTCRLLLSVTLFGLRHTVRGACSTVSSPRPDSQVEPLFHFDHTASKLHSLWHVSYLHDDFYDSYVCSHLDLVPYDPARCPDSAKPPQHLGFGPSYFPAIVTPLLSPYPLPGRAMNERTPNRYSARLFGFMGGLCSFVQGLLICSSFVRCTAPKGARNCEKAMSVTAVLPNTSCVNPDKPPPTLPSCLVAHR
jgi:hypothetical protein